MTKISSTEKEAIFAEEAFVVDVQILLNDIMSSKGVSRADLARAMNLSRARISQLFSDDCKNFTIRLLARAMHALDETPVVTCKHVEDQLRLKFECEAKAAIESSSNVIPIWDEETDVDIAPIAQDDRMEGLSKHFRLAA